MGVLKIVLVTTFISIFSLSGQDGEAPISTDRPSKSDSPYILLKGAFQNETGTSIERIKNQSGYITNYNYHSTLLKYGFNEYLELRLVTSYQGSKTCFISHPDVLINGISPLEIGGKFKLAERKGIWPQAAIISHIGIRMGSNEFQPKNMFNRVCLTLSHTLSDKLSLGYNINGNWGSDTSPFYLYTVISDYTISDRFAFFGELYCYNSKNSPTNLYADAGFLYKIKPRVQIDFSGGSILADKTCFFFEGGFSMRFLK